MRQYQVKIDEEVLSRLFTLDEMLESGLLDDYDTNIKVKALEESVWRVARDYPFPESESTSVQNNFVVNNDGTITRNKIGDDKMKYTINECGEAIRTDQQPSSMPSGGPSSSGDDEGCGCLILIGIAILIAIL